MPPQQQLGSDTAPAYGNPKTAFFHLFWKVRPYDFVFALATSRQHCCVLNDFACLQVSAVLVYIFCGIFSKSFVVNVVVIVLLLTLDFWTVRTTTDNTPGYGCRIMRSPQALSCPVYVQTKNISGRLLVGLRWWNETTDEGSNWRFESLEEVGIVVWVLTMPQHHDGNDKPVMLDKLSLPLGTESYQWKGFCLFLVVSICHGELWFSFMPWPFYTT